MPLFAPVSAGGVPKATVTATTGSPTIDSSTRAGKTIYKFNGSGSITIGTAGTCEVLIVGGGGSGGYGGGGGGGGGGYYYDTAAILPAGTLTVTVGPGGPTWARTAGFANPFTAVMGSPSRIGNLVAIGGGHGGCIALNTSSQNYNVNGSAGGSGGGGLIWGFGTGDTGTIGGSAYLGQGNSGATTTVTNGGASGGGGAGGAGTPGSATYIGGAGGAGLSNTIVGGAALFYSGGGGGSSQSTAAGGAGGSSVGGAGSTNNGAAGAGTANRGGGGGGANGLTGGAGGLGFVVVVIG